MKYRIKEIREQKGMSQVELAEKSGVTRATIWKLETSDSEATTTKTLQKLARALDVDMKQLFYG